MAQEDEENLDGLLQRIQAEKQKELRIRIERVRIKQELGHLEMKDLIHKGAKQQALMSEISKQKDLAKMKERQVEEELDRLSKDLSEKEKNFRCNFEKKKDRWNVETTEFNLEASRTMDLPTTKKHRSTSLYNTAEKSTNDTKHVIFLGGANPIDEQLRKIAKLKKDLKILEDKRSMLIENDQQDINSTHYARVGKVPSDLVKSSSECGISQECNSSKSNESIDLNISCDTLDEEISLRNVKAGQTLNSQSVLPTGPHSTISAFYKPSQNTWNFEEAFYPKRCDLANSFIWPQSVPFENGPVLPNQLYQSALYYKEMEISRLQQQIESIKMIEEQRAIEREHSRLRDTLTSLQMQIEGNFNASSMPRMYTSVDHRDHITGDGGGIEVSSENSSKTSATLACRSEPNQQLVSEIEKEHMEALMKVRHERDLLEEKEKLEEMRESIRRKKEEKQKEKEYQEWLSNQKRELIQLRIQKALIKEKPSTKEAKPEDLAYIFQDRPYSFENGFCIFWDCICGLPSTTTDEIRVTYALFDGKTPRSGFKLLSTRDCYLSDLKCKQFSLNSRKFFRKVTASPDLKLILELSAVSRLEGEDFPLTKSVGWSALSLFLVRGGSIVGLASGCHKLSIKEEPMPDPTNNVLGTPVGDDFPITVSLRLIPGEIGDESTTINAESKIPSGLHKAPVQSAQLTEELSPVHHSTPIMLQNSSHPPSDITVSRTPEKKLSAPSTEITQIPIGDAGQTPLLSSSSDKKDLFEFERGRQLSVTTLSRPLSTRPKTSALMKDSLRLQVVAETPTESDEEGDWMHVDKSAERRKLMVQQNLFHPGDGFNVYIDGARCLPDNVSITKVTMVALSSERVQINADGNIGFSNLESDCFNPQYDICVEYREPVFNPTLTLIIRLDTIDIYTKYPVILGYTSISVFLDLESAGQPLRRTAQQYILNEGAFRLPLYSNIQLGSAHLDLSDKCCDEFPKIPCATLLVRILKAKKSDDALLTLSRKDFPPTEWISRGIVIPPPLYGVELYDSIKSIPSPVEQKLYALRHRRRKKLVRNSLPDIMATEKIAGNFGFDIFLDSLKSKPTAFVDLHHICKFQAEIGFRVSIDALHNMKLKNAYFKTIFSVSPPASFYQDTRLTGDVHFTTTMDWSSSQGFPEYLDGFMTMRDISVVEDQPLVLILDVRALNKNKSGLWSSQSVGWSFLSILNEAGCVAGGSFQLPIFVGEVKHRLLSSKASIDTISEEIATEKRTSQLQLLEGASIFVRLEDPQVPNHPIQPLINAEVSKMIPAKLIGRYAFDSGKMNILKKKTPFSKLLPSNTSEKQMEKEINEAFAKEMGIFHYAF